MAVISAIFVSISASAQYRDASVYNDLYDSETVASLKRHVRELTVVQMEGRKAGSEGERLAADYIEDQMLEYGLDLLSPYGGDVFGIKTESGDTLTSRNIIGCVQGYDKELRDRYIVVGARIDNLGSMTMMVDGEPTQKIFAGANGNASGLSMMLELARMVQTNSILFRRSVIFVAFGASNETFAGSWYFLNRSFEHVENVDAMINLDMLGTGYDGFYAYTSSNPDINAILNKLRGELQPIHPEVVAAEPYPSDHRAFYAKEIPSVMLTTGRYPEHNTERDVYDILDFENMERELEYSYNLTLALAGHDDMISFHPEQVVKKEKTSDDVVSYYDCDQRPYFLNSPDPDRFLQKWVYQYLKYPKESLRNGVQGRVMVQFIINKDGSVSDVEVVKSVSPELDAEAVKVVSASPKWTPGRVNGNKVRTSIVIPVEFRLEKKAAPSASRIKK